jgi:DNA-binding protein HU-beta
MNKSELVALVAEKPETTKVVAEKAVDAVFDGITSSLASGVDVAVFGFGTFKVSQRAARTARNPITGASVQVPAKKAVKFAASKALKDTLNPVKKAPVKKGK